MKNFLLIDGNFFGHRLIHGIRIGQPEFGLTTLQEKNNFEVYLNNSLLSFFRAFNNDHHKLIDNIVFVFDNQSWRKSIEAHRPYYIDELATELISYKENRVAIKEESDIDWDAFDECMNNFRKKIEGIVCCISVLGCEGDDSLLFLTKKLSAQNINSIIFCTDGDLKQLVNNQTMLFRNIKSKISPNGEFCISPGLYKKLFSEKTAMEIMTKSTFDNSFHKNLFNVDLAAGEAKSTIVREAGTSILIPEPVLGALCKVICGDKKDNVFPIFRWQTNDKFYKVTEKMIEKAWKVHGMPFNEQSAIQTLNDQEILINLLVALRGITKQVNAPMKSVGTHFKHNMRIIMLQETFIPEDVKQRFDNAYLVIENRLIEKELTLVDLMTILNKTEIMDNAKELLINSLPTGNEEIVKSETNSLIDDILNGK